MKKAIWFIVIAIMAVVIGFIIQIYIFRPKKEDNILIAENNVNTSILENINYPKVEEITTNAREEKISINTAITQIIYYNKCNHQIQNTIKDVKKYINMNKEQLQNEFPKWEIKEFNPERVVLYKEEEDFCNEHFLVKNEDGFVTIYTIDNNEQILELLNKTEIAVEYLTKVDQDNLNNGIIIYTKQNLNKLIEDFE